MLTTVQKTVCVAKEQWNRVESAAKERDITLNYLLVKLAMVCVLAPTVAPAITPVTKRH